MSGRVRGRDDGGGGSDDDDDDDNDDYDHDHDDKLTGRASIARRLTLALGPCVINARISACAHGVVFSAPVFVKPFIRGLLVVVDVL